MDIERLKQHWEDLGRMDPLWANLTVPGRDHGGWDLDEFLATGSDQVRRYLAMLDELGIVVARDRALDFGCGVGRLTQGLAEHFEACDGVDIASSMIAMARAVNRHGERCRFHVNESPDLSLFDDYSFDFVLSVIVLQHMEPRYALAYVGEFVRVLRPGGTALFQVPAATKATAPTALPERAWRMSLVADDPPTRLTAGEPAEIRVRVRNDSPVAWPADAQVRLGNMWRDGDGRLMVTNDGRTALPGEVAPGQEVVLPLRVTPPNAPGGRVLELDVVQEQVAWFSERGSKTLQLPLVLEPGGRESIAGHAPPPEGADFEPWMQMFAVSRDEVSAVVEAHQGRVLDVLAGEQAGPAYEDHLYVVGRSSDWSARPVIARLSAAVAEIPDRPDMLPPVFSNRRGVRRRLELAIRRTAARLTRWFTRTQVDHDRAVARSLAEMQTALAVHDAELRALRSELARSSSRAEAPDA